MSDNLKDKIAASKYREDHYYEGCCISEKIYLAFMAGIEYSENKEKEKTK